ncbi:MAG: DUF1801 domain-containing protein [Chitinophagaceae bacterium]
MSIPEFIKTQPQERQKLLSDLHAIIVEMDKTISPEISQMMGTQMIIYNAPGTFKYGLASVKNHMSLHLLPMYSSPALYEKYKTILPNASFQKGCINFRNELEMPLKIVKNLISDCSKIDLPAIRQQQLASRRKKS